MSSRVSSIALSRELAARQLRRRNARNCQRRVTSCGGGRRRCQKLAMYFARRLSCNGPVGLSPITKGGRCEVLVDREGHALPGRERTLDSPLPARKTLSDEARRTEGRAKT